MSDASMVVTEAYPRTGDFAIDAGSPIRRCTRLWIILLLLLGFAATFGASGGHAQEATSLIAEADSAMARFDSTRAEYGSLSDRLDTLGGEDSLITFRSMAELLINGLNEINDMAGLLVRMEEAKLDGTKLRNYLTELLPRVALTLDFMEQDIQAQLESAAQRRSEAESGDLGVIAAEITQFNTQLDEVYGAATQYLKMLDQIGIDSSEPRDELKTKIEERAQLTAGRLRLAIEEREKYQKQLKQSPDDATFRQMADAAQATVDGQVASLERTVSIMDQLELDGTEYRTLLVEATGELSRGLGDADVAVSLLQKGLERVGDWFVNSGPGLAIKLLVFLAILLVFRLIAKVVRKAVMHSIDSSKLKPSQLMRTMIANMTGKVVMLFGFLVALSQLGISLGPLLAGLGVAGFILGFALQETLANFAAGLMILFYRPFDVGDMVEVAGVTGKVSHMSLVSSTILTIDNQTLIVPNGKIWGDVIRNVTAQEKRRVDLMFGISYSDDIPHAESILTSILKEHEKVLDDPEPIVKLHELGDSSVNFVVRPWVKTEDYWDVLWHVTREVKIRFDREGISIPFPQRDVHLYQPPPEAARNVTAGNTDEPV